MNDQGVLHSDGRGRRGSVPQFPKSVSGVWEEICLFWRGGEYARTRFGGSDESKIAALHCLVRALSDDGDPFAKNLLGVMYEMGRGVPENYDIAASLYRDVALTGELPIAWYNLGMNYWRRKLYYQAVESFLKGKQLGCTWCVAWLAAGSA